MEGLTYKRRRAFFVVEAMVLSVALLLTMPMAMADKGGMRARGSNVLLQRGRKRDCGGGGDRSSVQSVCPLPGSTQSRRKSEECRIECELASLIRWHCGARCSPSTSIA